MAQGTNNIQGGTTGQSSTGLPMRPGTAGATSIQQNRGGAVGQNKGFQDRIAGAGPYHQGTA